MTNKTSKPELNRLASRIFWRHRGRMLFFALCIAVGVGCLFTIENFLDSINELIAGKARETLAADVTLASWRPFTPEIESSLAQLKKEGYQASRTLAFSSMAKPLKARFPFLVSVRAIEESYPLYGNMEVSPSDYRERFFAGNTCLIGQQLAIQYKIDLGDKIFLGGSTLEVIGFILKEPGQSFRGTFSPRIMVPFSEVKKTGLIQYASRISRACLLACPPHLQDSAKAARELKERLRRELSDPYLRMASYTESQPTVREVLQRVSTFFVLVSLVTLILGIIGMATSVTTFFHEQLETIGTLRCLGLTSSHISQLYLRLCFFIGLLGGTLGILIGVIFSYTAQIVMEQVFSIPVPVSIQIKNVLAGLFFAILITLGANYAAVSSLAKVVPLDILRGRLKTFVISRQALGITITIGLGLLFLYTLQSSNSPKIAFFFTISLVGIVLFSLLLILLSLRVLEIFLRRLVSSSFWGFSLRHGWRQLIRQKARSITFFLALTLGITLLCSLELIEHSLVREISVDEEDSRPDIFLVDVQKSQISSVKKIMSDYAKSSKDFSPLIRARLTHINGESVKRKDIKELSMEERRRQRFLTREYNLTYKDTLNSSETITEGKFWEEGESRPLISLEKRFAERLGLSLNDTMSFDIQGRKLEGEIVAIRSINWVSMSPNFFVIFPRKVLEPAPQMLITSLAVHDSLKIATFREELFDKHPNIIVINAGQILESVRQMLTYLIGGLKGVGWICAAIGLLILIGTLSMGKVQRRRKILLLRSLGSSSQSTRAIDFVEFASIGLITAVIVGLLSYSWSFFLAQQVGVVSHDTLEKILPYLLVSVFLPVVVGLFSNRRLYREVR